MDPVQKPSFFGKYKFTIISLIVLIIAIIPLIILSQKSHKIPTSETMLITTPTPTVVPLNQQNVQPTMDSADQQMQTSLNQVDTDLQTVNQINTSSDSTTGL